MIVLLGGSGYVGQIVRCPDCLSHLDQFVAACYTSWKNHLDFGIYNLTNSGSISAREIVAMIQDQGLTQRNFEFFDDEQQFIRVAAKTPRSNTVLDNSKAISAGLDLPDVAETVRTALRNWSDQACIAESHLNCDSNSIV